VILLDTNVLSALMRRQGDPAVVTWLDDQPAESIWTTAITVFEIRFGLEVLARGRRRRLLEDRPAPLVQPWLTAQLGGDAPVQTQQDGMERRGAAGT
jgi:predicted nucleic acid-binding protein